MLKVLVIQESISLAEETLSHKLMAQLWTWIRGDAKT